MKRIFAMILVLMLCLGMAAVAEESDLAYVQGNGKLVVGITDFEPMDFKKKGGFLRSIHLSKEYGFYRQNFCGCEFSRR